MTRLLLPPRPWRSLLALALAAGLASCNSFDPTSLGPGCTCACFASQSQANQYVRAYPASRAGLDADGDGRACEALP